MGRSKAMKIVADNIQIIRKDIENAVNSFCEEPIVTWVKTCERLGADMIDINTGPLTRNPGEKMRFIVETVQNTTRLPLMLDTANPAAMEEGLKVCRQTPYLNGFSLEPHKLENLLPLAVQYRTPIVGYLLNPDSSVPINASERLDRAITLYDESIKRGLLPDQLIIDPVLVPLLWADGSSQAMDVLEVIRTLPDLLGFPVKTIIGLSNLTTGAKHRLKKQIMERAYAAMLCASGIDMVLLNIQNQDTMDTLSAASMLKESAIFTWEQLQVHGDRA